MKRDSHLIGEAYRIIREQGPLAAGFQGMTQGIAPYAAGAMAGAKQLGQNVAGAVAGSPTAPQSPVTAGKQVFNQAQMNQAIDGVMKVFNLPQEWRRLVIDRLNQLAREVGRKDASATQRFNQYQANQQLTQPVAPAQIPAPRV